MSNNFSIARARCSVLDDPALRDEITAHTGDDRETSAILRSLERFGADLTIQYYEITPKAGRRTHHDPRAITWSVTAVRS